MMYVPVLAQRMKRRKTKKISRKRKKMIKTNGTLKQNMVLETGQKFITTNSSMSVPMFALTANVLKIVTKIRRSLKKKIRNT